MRDEFITAAPAIVMLLSVAVLSLVAAEVTTRPWTRKLARVLAAGEAGAALALIALISFG